MACGVYNAARYQGDAQFQCLGSMYHVMSSDDILRDDDEIIANSRPIIMPDRDKIVLMQACTGQMYITRSY